MSDQPVINQLIKKSSVHEEWMEPLAIALKNVDPDYLHKLLKNTDWLPGPEKLFAAFQRDLTHCRYILFGESPYPRAESAKGIAFYDAAVTDLWSEKGLSKAVNRATSLRNLLKTMLLAEGLIQPDPQGKISQSQIAVVDKCNLIQTIDQLFDALQQKGFLLFNATPVLHPANSPTIEARYWAEFVNRLLAEITHRLQPLPTLVLWGKIAQKLETMPAAAAFSGLRSEHPYNISFIHNSGMLQLFSKLQLLQPM